MRALSADTNRLWSGIVGYADCFGMFHGAFLFLLGHLLPRAGRREVSARVPGSSARLFVRPRTTDISVFSQIYRGHEYELDFATSPRLIVDAGAYTGLSTAFFAARYPHARIIAIEPDEENFKLLMRNTEGMANVHAIHAALWAESGQVTLTDPGRGAWALMVRQADYPEGDIDRMPAKQHQRTVQAITMSDLIRDHKISRVDLLKLDVEGSEIEIFADAADWITQVDAICLELHDQIRSGCSRAFFKAVEDFPIEFWRGDNVLVLRDRSILAGRGLTL